MDRGRLLSYTATLGAVPWAEGLWPGRPRREQEGQLGAHTGWLSRASSTCHGCSATPGALAALPWTPCLPPSHALPIHV